MTITSTHHTYTALKELFIDPKAEKYFIIDDKYEATENADFYKVCEFFGLNDYKVFWEDNFTDAFLIWYEHQQKGIRTQVLDANAICTRLKL